LRIPGQVAREFADNRAEKLKTLFQQLSRKRDVSLSRSEYPLLEGIPAYKEVARREAEITVALDDYRKAIGSLLDTIATWHWDDPISQIYRDLFKAPTVVDPEVDREKLLEELKYRQDHRIPPGYKDANNDYSGIGDLLIWKTILKIGEEESCHLVFVSGDEKTDWRYQSENRALYPRFELIDEYRVVSKGKSLLIITFAELLEQFGAPAPVVEEVRQEEAAASLEKSASTFVAAFRALQQSLNVDLLRKYLKHRYPDRQQFTSATDLSELVNELRSRHINTLTDLDQMLTRSEPAFELSEAEDPPSGEGGRKTRFAGMGVVRRSLAIVDDEYRVAAGHEDVRGQFARWRTLLI
jgi:PIN like domain